MKSTSVVKRTRRLALAGLVLSAATYSAFAAESPRDERAIADVAAGKMSEARASWWGFRAEDSTAALQAAFDSRAKRVVVDKQSGPWIVDELRLRSDLEVFFEPGVEVLAKKGAFQGGSAALFTAADCKNLRLIGPGATLRMRRDDYARPPYRKAEWRHVLNLRGCEHVLVKGLTLAESGGDGIYVAPGTARKECKDVTVQDVVCDRNYRQGISVISAEDLLIENCILKGTGGTAPAAGIDFEPNHPHERLVNCVMRNCVIEDNEGYALHIYARQFDGSTADMSIRIERCVTRGTNARSVSIATSNGGPQGSVKGRIELVDCQFVDRGRAGVVIGSKPVDGPKLLFRNCVVADSGSEPAVFPPLVFSSRSGDTGDVGGVAFERLTVELRGDQPVLRFDDRVGLALSDLTGDIAVRKKGATRRLELNPATLDELIPSNSFVRVRSVDLSARKWAMPRTKPAAILPHRLRDYAVYWVWARQGETVECQLKHERVGKGTGDPMAVSVLDPRGKPIATSSVPPDKSASVSFTAKESGAYRVACEPHNHTVQMVACTHPFAVSGRNSVIHFIRTPGDIYFHVPRGVSQFAVRAQGEGDGERVGVVLFDETGREVWSRPNLGGAEHHIVTRGPSSEAATWRVRMSRAPEGVLEDHYLELRGVPPILGFSPETVPTPAP